MSAENSSPPLMLPSPLQMIGRKADCEIWVKRDDLIHPHISGNKWRKLKYHLSAFRQSGKQGILTFGGAFSNHLLATAALCREEGITCRALLRGEEAMDNPTLQQCRAWGMKLTGISRQEYRRKAEVDFLKKWAGDDYVIPEGGKGLEGLQGCVEIMRELPPDFDDICCPAGTATTFTGLLLSRYPARYHVYPALKIPGFPRGEVQELYEQFSTSLHGKKMSAPPFTIHQNYHFGGFAKVTEPLIHFMNDFYDKYGIPLDPVYTAKMFYGLWQDLDNNVFPAGARILALHTGGLQGIKGMNQRLKDVRINYGN